jgi:isopenicillin-N epimerase
MNHNFPSEYSHLWALDPSAIYLNHGSFGACTKFILEKQKEYRDRLEHHPMRFLIRELEGMLDPAREKLARFANADVEDLVFVKNATEGVYTVLRSLKFEPGDEILFTNHIYYACRKQLEYISELTGAVLREAWYDIPIHDPEQIVEAVLKEVSPRTKLALIDHITSATALVQPVDRIIQELDLLGIDTLIDGAHVLGSIPLDLKKLRPAYFTSNCHKWLCSPKTAAILYVRKDKQSGIVPPLVSHAGHKAEPFAERFFWPGTWDPSAVFCAADSIDYMGGLLPGGWPAIMKRNHDLAVEARTMILSELGVEPSCPDEMLASMATYELPTNKKSRPFSYKGIDDLQEEMYREFNLELPIWSWSNPPRRISRISVQLYNSMDQYIFAIKVLKQKLG